MNKPPMYASEFLSPHPWWADLKTKSQLSDK